MCLSLDLEPCASQSKAEPKVLPIVSIPVYVLSKFKLFRYRAVVVLVIALLIMIFEIVLSYPVFKSQYNWFHIP